MMNKSKMKRFLILSLAVAAFVLVSGSFAQAQKERDPFQKLERGKPKPTTTTTTTTTTGTTTTGTTTTQQKPVKPAIVVVSAPPIEQRIEYYKRMREMAVANGQRNSESYERSDA